MKGLSIMTTASQAREAAQNKQQKTAAKTSAVTPQEEVQTSVIFMFARTLGSTHRKTLAESEELHKAFVKASDANKRIMRHEFLIGLVCGYMSVPRDTAETVINGRVRYGAQPTLVKPARTKDQQNAYDAARKLFSFHISRDDKRIAPPRKQIRLSKPFKDAAIAFVGEFFEEVNAASLGEVISMLQALRKRIDKVIPHEDHSEHTKH
jgi:hypothetical protein